MQLDQAGSRIVHNCQVLTRQVVSVSKTSGGTVSNTRADAGNAFRRMLHRPGEKVLLALLMIVAGLGSVKQQCATATFVPQPALLQANRQLSAGRSGNFDLDVPDKSSSAHVDQVAEDGWRMMPLGVPKVAYRIPGAPNAEWVDIYNRLYRERIIFLGKEIDDRLANEIIGVLLYLDSEDNNKPIYLYINSPGGSVISGLALYDTMQHIKSPVVTINVGLAASMASFLLASGEKGKRLALPHSRTMIHQAVGGAQGQAEDIKVEATQILQIHENLVRMYARMTGKPADTVRQDLMRDNFMSAEEAKEYGIIDQVIKLQDIALEKREAPEAPADSTEAQKGTAATTEATSTTDEEPDTKAV